MNIVNASIITIGDELLIGQTIDTNSAFIAQELNKIGVWVRRRIAVGDVYDEIWQALDEESQHSDIIIITGGLGPTADDITKPLLCNYFGGKMVVNEEVLTHVKHLFEVVLRHTGPILESNLKQAEVPDVCTVLMNKRGTAPGMFFGPGPTHRNEKAPPNPPQGKASPNPSKRGALDSEESDIHYGYQTADSVVYGMLKNFVKDNKNSTTLAEGILWEKIRGKKLDGYKFRRQHIIDCYIADFICLKQRLIIEVDGLIHQVPENKLSDAARTIELSQIGFKVLRFTNDEVIQNIDNVLNTILFELNNRKTELAEYKFPPSEGREAIFISLPGVPHEMKGLMMDQVIPRLQQEFVLPAIVHKTAFTAGLGESMLAELLKEFEPSLPPHIKLAYLPNYGMVKLRLTTVGNSKEEVEKELMPYFAKMMNITNDYLVSDEDEGLELVVGKILKQKGKTMGTAESCTGGYIAHLITSVPGSSVYFNGSVVSYSYEAKENILGVKKETLELTGAVSEETVIEMARGALKTLNVDFVVAVSGIMGPEGGTDDKPVGTVWIAVANVNKVETLKLNLRFDRKRNIGLTSAYALNFLRKFILKN